eukprot:Nk52_evm29s279 gene=Nk52_evmTU29s279
MAQYAKKHGNAAFKEFQRLDVEHVKARREIMKMKKKAVEGEEERGQRKEREEKLKELATRRKNKFEEAIKRYTEGIESGCEDSEMIATLLTNRAAVHLTVKNYGSCVRDCDRAREMGSKNIKAFVRAAKSNFALEKFAETIDWCDAGLDNEIDPCNEELIDLRKKAVAAKNRIEKMQRMKERKMKGEIQAARELVDALRVRGVTLRESMWSESILDHPKYRTLTGTGENGDEQVFADVNLKYVTYLRSSDMKGVYLSHTDANGKEDKTGPGILNWPVCFLYPEYKQSDFISEFAEFNSIEDHLETMFPPVSSSPGPAVPWDSNNAYHHEDLVVYYETARLKGRADMAEMREATRNEHMKTQLVRVDMKQPLVEILSDGRFSVVNGIPVFYVLVKGSAFEKEFKKRHESVV